MMAKPNLNPKLSHFQNIIIMMEKATQTERFESVYELGLASGMAILYLGAELKSQTKGFKPSKDFVKIFPKTGTDPNKTGTAEELLVGLPKFIGDKIAEFDTVPKFIGVVLFDLVRMKEELLKDEDDFLAGFWAGQTFTEIQPTYLGLREVAAILAQQGEEKWNSKKVSDYHRNKKVSGQFGKKLPEPATYVGDRPLWTKQQIDEFIGR